MRPNLNEKYDSNILTLFRNGITCIRCCTIRHTIRSEESIDQVVRSKRAITGFIKIKI